MFIYLTRQVFKKVENATPASKPGYSHVYMCVYITYLHIMVITQHLLYMKFFINT